MDSRSLDRSLAILAALAGAIVAVIVIGIVATQSSQDFFQQARPVDAYAARLALPLASFGLRLNLGLDNLFLLVYAAFFVLLAARFSNMLDARLLGVALAAMMLTTFLDALENHHIIAMVHSLEAGLPLSVADGQLQMVASQIKFHSSYLAVLLFSFGYLQLGRLGRVIAVLLWCYIPCGVLISVLPVDSARPLVLGRTLFFVLAFLLSAVLFLSRSRRGSEPRGLTQRAPEAKAA
jgi:hypothetical protein